MSPLLSSVRAVLWPPVSEFWGLSIGTQEIVACQLLHQNNQWTIAAVNAEATPIPLYKELPVADSSQKLATAITRVAAGAAGKCLPFSVVIPDPAINTAILELETIPKTGAEREALARWHLQKNSPPDTDLACITQNMGTNDDKHYLLASAMTRAWFDGLLSACRIANVAPTFWQSAIAYRFNRFEEQLFRNGEDGALLTIDPASWSLLFWDQAGRVRHLRSRWRDQGTDKEAETIAIETERAVRAYVHGQSGRQLNTVHFIGESELANDVASLLEARMQKACARLSPLAGLAVAEGVSPQSADAMLAITVALEGKH